MSQTEAIVKVLAHIATQMAAFCVEKGLTTEQAVRLVSDVIANDTARKWAALQVIALTRD
jgi:hypothetical protein